MSGCQYVCVSVFRYACVHVLLYICIYVCMFAMCIYVFYVCIYLCENGWKWGGGIELERNNRKWGEDGVVLRGRGGDGWM